MTNRTTPTVDEMRALHEQLRDLTREAHGVLNDLHREIREARSLVPILARELFQAEVKKQVDALGAATQQAMDAAVVRVDTKFEELFTLYTRGSRRDRRTGQPPLADLLQAHVAAKNTAADPGVPDA